MMIIKFSRTLALSSKSFDEIISRDFYNISIDPYIDLIYIWLLGD